MRLVLDTSTVVSGLLWKRAEHTLLAEAGGRVDLELYASSRLLAELADVLSRNKLARPVAASGQSPDQLMSRYSDVVRVVAAAEISPVVLNDPDDDHVLACALSRASRLRRFRRSGPSQPEVLSRHRNRRYCRGTPAHRPELMRRQPRRFAPPAIFHGRSSQRRRAATHGYRRSTPASPASFHPRRKPEWVRREIIHLAALLTANSLGGHADRTPPEVASN